MNSRISIEDLKRISNQIKDDTNRMSDLYNNTISKALENCKADLIVAGMSFDEVQNSFKNLFTSLTTQLNEFTDAMNNKILPNYESTTSAIAKLFNQDFANEMNEFLRIINSN